MKRDKTAEAAPGRTLPRRVLIANRGEIALRVARTCRAHGVGVVAVHAPDERAAPHVLAADAAREVPSYLDSQALVEAAQSAGCDAVHPGYGFLSETAAFARAVTAAGLTWIGPPPAAMDIMGSKTAARAAMEKAGVPLIPGTAAASPERLIGPAAAIGYPVLVKPSAGGGGKGMARVDRPADLPAAARSASEQALRAFGDGAVYVEKLIERPRHVEIQVFGDQHGSVTSLGERECSIQRRHQKVIEECPSPAVDHDLRLAMSEAAIAAAKAVGYVGAGTVEFLLAPDGSFHFLEMNTRLQVEHPVTEWVTGLDLVLLQLQVACGAALPQEALTPVLHGHAIEARIYAEDPAAGHLPQAGPLLVVREPAGPGLRVDSALVEGGVVSVDYDPMLAKLSAWGRTREEATLRLCEALARFVILGVRTNIDFLHDVLAHEAFRAGDLTTAFLDEHFAAWTGAAGAPPAAAIAATALAPTAGNGTRSAATAQRALDDPWRAPSGYRVGAPELPA